MGVIKCREVTRGHESRLQVTGELGSAQLALVQSREAPWLEGAERPWIAPKTWALRSRGEVRRRRWEPELEEGTLLCVPRSLPAPPSRAYSISRLAACDHALGEGDPGGEEPAQDKEQGFILGVAFLRGDSGPGSSPRHSKLLTRVTNDDVVFCH